MSPQVTVLMSVYNGEKYLREAIESIINQTYSNFEFLIMNDGSTDTTREIILSYDDPRITLIENNENMGLSKSLNRGIARARGKYIARQDADDISHVMRLEREYSSMCDGDCDVVYCRFEYMDKIGKRLSWVSVKSSSHNLKKRLIDLEDPIAHGSVLMRKDTIMQAGGYNELLVFSQDYELWLRLLSMDKEFKLVDYVDYYQRLLPRENKTKRAAQRRYTTLIIDYYLRGKEMPTSELADLYEPGVSYHKKGRCHLYSQFIYWLNIKRINIKVGLSNHFPNLYQLN